MILTIAKNVLLQALQHFLFLAEETKFIPLSHENITES